MFLEVVWKQINDGVGVDSELQGPLVTRNSEDGAGSFWQSCLSPGNERLEKRQDLGCLAGLSVLLA